MRYVSKDTNGTIPMLIDLKTSSEIPKMQTCTFSSGSVQEIARKVVFLMDHLQLFNLSLKHHFFKSLKYFVG
jgi:hypothetical protein